ncbi:MAG: hypothetical protein FJ109_12675 [Deltaproteobacteria bacterium]|nr:hypothetical protein [Deltaproteobacteria bacterium]
MVRKLIWVLACLLAGGAVVPASHTALWAMRGRFIEGYREARSDCRRALAPSSAWEGRLTEEMEAEAGRTLAASPALQANVPCSDFLKAVAGYREAMPGRSFGFGVIVTLALLVVRFVMFPMSTGGEEWIERG